MKVKHENLRFTAKIFAAVIIAVAVMLSARIFGHAAEDAQTGDTVTVVGDSVNVRSSADTTSDPVGQAKSGDSFTVVEVTQVGDHTWYKVTNSNISEGYIRGDLVEVTATAEPIEQTEPAEVSEEPVEETPAEETSSSDSGLLYEGITVVEPEESEKLTNIPAGFVETPVKVSDEQSVTGYFNAESNFIIVCATDKQGVKGWYLMDLGLLAKDGEARYVTYKESLFNSGAGAQKAATGGSSKALTIILGIAAVVFLLVAVVFGIRLFGNGEGVGRNYYDDDDDDDDEDDDYDDDDDDDDEDDDDEEDDEPEERPVRKAAPDRSRSARPAQRAVAPAVRRSSSTSRSASRPSGSHTTVAPKNTVHAHRDADRQSYATANEPSNVRDRSVDTQPTRVVSSGASASYEGAPVTRSSAQARTGRPVTRTAVRRNVQSGARQATPAYTKARRPISEDED